MKKITNLLSMVLLMLCMGLTSCDDILGQFDNPFGPLSISVKSIELDADEMTLTVGDVGQLIATVGPENATDKTVTWTSSNESVATVDATGKVTAIAKGTAKIKAKAGSISTTCIVTVKAATVAVTSVTLDKTELALTVGDAAVQLTATVKPDNATDADVDWSSSDQSVATVDGSGLVTAVAEGIATITAKAGGKTAECTVTVAADPLATPLTLEVLTDGTITVTNPQPGMYYKKNGGDQVALTANVNATINVTKDDKVEFYGTATSYNGTRFGGTAEVNVYGNIMSLISATGFADNKKLTADHTFSYLFYGYANLKDASNLFLPATTLATQCYYQMFRDCTNLTTAPEELPAATLTQECYYAMFYNCSSLTTAPALPAETLTEGCYMAMFQNCISLTTAPKLPAESLANSCYRQMFYNCSSLTTAPKLPAESLANDCYRSMFRGCTSLTTAPKLPATTLADYCYYAMFNQCTGLKDAYVKAAYVDTNKECFGMFLNCSATGAKLHTTNATSWTGYMGGANWTAVDDWTD